MLGRSPNIANSGYAGWEGGQLGNALWALTVAQALFRTLRSAQMSGCGRRDFLVEKEIILVIDYMYMCKVIEKTMFYYFFPFSHFMKLI